jgi:inward rectifier potassium channel
VTPASQGPPRRDEPAAAPQYQIRVLGARSTPLRDFYHSLLRKSWRFLFAVIGVVFLVVNALFAAAFAAVGGVANARPGSLVDAFFFSVQSFATIGYGAFYPQSAAANALVVVESLAALILVALATGLVFAKFSRPTARIVFTRQVVVSPVNGQPTLSFRIGNQRGNRIVDAQIRVSLTRTEKTGEGKTFYRMLDLPLTRDRALSLSRSWSVLHTIDDASPLYGATPASIARDEAELQVMVVGFDDTTMQAMHASHTYMTADIVWGARHADVLTEEPNGDLTLDLGNFHRLEQTPPTGGFPYSYATAEAGNPSPPAPVQADDMRRTRS